MAAGRVASICPKYYPTAGLLHVGEICATTYELLAYLRRCEKPESQIIFRTVNKTPLDEQPLPAIDRIDVNSYFMMPIQFSVGCPYTCEFCDIPAIYGRNARVKEGDRIVRELDAVYQRGFVGMILFVDDNLIANRKALRAMLPRLIEWQHDHNYPFALTGEATINLARDSKVLQLLHDARFTNIFFGIESVEEKTLVEISKKQNTQDPLVDSIRTIQSYGIEVIYGMILGFDTDTEDSGRRMADFIRATNPSVVYFNLLAALPKTLLWSRLEKEGRLINDDGDVLRSEELLNCLSTNIAYKLPNQTVAEMLRCVIAEVYAPEEIYRRFRWNAENVYGKQIQGIPPVRTIAQKVFAIRFALGTFWKIAVGIGLRADYRRHFWRYCGQMVRLRFDGRILSLPEVVCRVTPDAHHLITWGRRYAG